MHAKRFDYQEEGKELQKKTEREESRVKGKEKRRMISASFVNLYVPTDDKTKTKKQRNKDLDLIIEYVRYHGLMLKRCIIDLV